MQLDRLGHLFNNMACENKEYEVVASTEISQDGQEHLMII
jgi:hypothetical protein